jgi:hypothetical protein
VGGPAISPVQATQTTAIAERRTFGLGCFMLATPTSPLDP